MTHKRPVAPRIVRNRARAAELRKRGDNVWWSVKHNAWLWTPRVIITEIDPMHDGRRTLLTDLRTRQRALLTDNSRYRN